ncbi:MAG: hypothetical protein ABEN55_12065 [Bradymonadaceae bacterium]
MSDFSTYTVFVPVGQAESFRDAVNKPAEYDPETYPDDGTNELGIVTEGMDRWAPENPSTQPGLDDTPDPAGPPKARYFHGPVRSDIVDRFKSICEDHNATVVETDPDNDDLPSNDPEALEQLDLWFVPDEAEV